MEATNTNKLYNKIVEERNGNYCHAIEVNSIYEIESIIESVFQNYESEEITEKDILNFFESIQLYFLEDEEATEEENRKNEDEVYNFNFENYIFPSLEN
jgi:hypothetical protein